MGNYFKPWRRKFGLLTLLAACAFTALWVCSLADDGVLFTDNLFGFGEVESLFIFNEDFEGNDTANACGIAVSEQSIQLVKFEAITQEVTSSTPTTAVGGVVTATGVNGFTVVPVAPSPTSATRTAESSESDNEDQSIEDAENTPAVISPIPFAAAVAITLRPVVSIPLWSIVLPLTLLSAWLLLSNRKEAQISNPVEPRAQSH